MTLRHISRYAVIAMASAVTTATACDKSTPDDAPPTASKAGGADTSKNTSGSKKAAHTMPSAQMPDLELVTDDTRPSPLDRIELPAGFDIAYWAKDLDNAREMALSEEGWLFVGSRRAGNVYALRDTNGDHKADERHTIASGLNSPNGVALRDGDLYVAEIDRVLRFDDIVANLPDPSDPTVITDAYPSDQLHGWKFIDFGPDGHLYVPVGAPCNVCERDDEIYSTITRIDPDGSDQEIFARGVRNTVGFTWHPETKELWFTDNGRDRMGNNKPSDELNHAPKAGMHFGFPYCHAGDIPDPEFGDARDCSEFTPPAHKLGPHVAALGLTFYTGEMFPDAYTNQILIAEHGSWNRDIPIGYRVSMAVLDKEHNVVRYAPFAKGWLNEEKAQQGINERFGRPVDVLVMPDGALLVSDDDANAIYRISLSSFFIQGAGMGLR